MLHWVFIIFSLILSAFGLYAFIYIMMKGSGSSSVGGINLMTHDEFKGLPEEMKKLYNYLGFDYFEHHFQNMEQLTHENDTIHGIFGDHTIKPNIQPLKDDYLEILGKEQSDRIRNHYDWFYKRFNYL